MILVRETINRLVWLEWSIPGGRQQETARGSWGPAGRAPSQALALGKWCCLVAKTGSRVKLFTPQLCSRLGHFDQVSHCKPQFSHLKNRKT